MEFDNKNSLVGYLSKVFGKVASSSTIALTSIFNIFKETTEFFTGGLFGGLGEIGGSSGGKNRSR